MLKSGRCFAAGLFVLTSSCLIVSEKDKCYTDIEKGDKTGGFDTVCELAAIYSTSTNEQLINFYLSLCVGKLVEEEKCSSKSSIKPTIDFRM